MSKPSRYSEPGPWRLRTCLSHITSSMTPPDGLCPAGFTITKTPGCTQLLRLAANNVDHDALDRGIHRKAIRFCLLPVDGIQVGKTANPGTVEVFESTFEPTFFARAGI